MRIYYAHSLLAHIFACKCLSHSFSSILCLFFCLPFLHCFRSPPLLLFYVSTNEKKTSNVITIIIFNNNNLVRLIKALEYICILYMRISHTHVYSHCCLFVCITCEKFAYLLVGKNFINSKCCTELSTHTTSRVEEETYVFNMSRAPSSTTE